jgi:hypothetical protein
MEREISACDRSLDKHRENQFEEVRERSAVRFYDPFREHLGEILLECKTRLDSDDGAVPQLLESLQFLSLLEQVNPCHEQNAGEAGGTNPAVGAIRVEVLTP